MLVLLLMSLLGVVHPLQLDWIPNVDSPTLPYSTQYRQALSQLCHSLKIHKEYPDTLNPI